MCIPRPTTAKDESPHLSRTGSVPAAEWRHNAYVNSVQPHSTDTQHCQIKKNKAYTFFVHVESLGETHFAYGNSSPPPKNICLFVEPSGVERHLQDLLVRISSLPQNLQKLPRPRDGLLPFPTVQYSDIVSSSLIYCKLRVPKHGLK